MSDEQVWMQHLEEFREYLQSEGNVGESAQIQYPSFAKRWIEFCLPRGHDPATFNQQLLDQLLKQGRTNETSRRNYASYLRRWTRWASGEDSPTHRAPTGTQQQHDDIAMWMARLEEYLSYLRHRGRKPSTIKKRRRHLSKWVRYACSTGRIPAAWDPSAVEEAFVVWDTVESPGQRDYISRRIQVWCRYWRGSGLDSLTLEDLVQQFRYSGYPDEETQHHLAARAEFERVLQSLPGLSYERRAQLRSVWKRTIYDYGGPGVTAGIDATIRDVSEANWPSMRDRIHALCYGDGDLAARFDETTASIKGLGELMATRFLAITQPQRFLPNFIARSSNSKWPGKLDAIELLDRLELLTASTADEAQLLLEIPQGSLSVGGRAVRSNDLLLEVLHPYFSDDGSVDTFGMKQFLHWLAERYADDDTESDDDHDDDGDEPGSTGERLAIALGEAAEDLLCGVEFLNDIVELLEDKGQVILYGPPGTGKTYFAQRFAQALTGTRFTAENADENWMRRLDAYCLHLEQDQKVQPGTHRSIARRWIEFALERELDPSVWDESLYTEFADLNPGWQDITRKTHRYDLRRWCDWASGGEGSHWGGLVSLVQFHPAYSYEDFFEGFRPRVDDEGQMTYELTAGPLMKIAELARANPNLLHVMVIDEINRANLPRVLGELLFLLEYRDRSIQTQYRPDGDFRLPKNLRFICTMNTADRSIALIDAAMRRRFHFVPFFPDREPTAGLLRRWCEENEPGQVWVADLLKEVNERLRADLGGDYMLIGPSHFMKSNLDKEGLRQIWEYNIEPLIEDQFFGRQDVIDSYRFGEVWDRHGPSVTAPDSETGTPTGPGEDAESQSLHDEGTASQGGR